MGSVTYLTDPKRSYWDQFQTLTDLEGSYWRQYHTLLIQRGLIGFSYILRLI